MSESRVALLDIAHASRIFVSGDSEIRALDDVSLTVWPGEFVAIMGQSGSGKTTLMNIIGCLDRLTSGTYHVLGQDVATMDADRLAQLRRETFGFVFQRYNLLATETAAENVEIPAVYAGADFEARFARAKELLGRLGLENRLDHRPSQLSGGQQQRVAIARALMNNPPLILADEPTGALDSKSGADVMALLHELHAEGRTIVLITHDEKVASNAERIVQLMDGKISGETKVKKSIATSNAVATAIHTGTITITASAGEATRMAFKSLRVNIFRTSLTLLGIVIGVAAVVTMLAVGAGSKQKVLDQITAMGTNLLMVLPGAPGVRPSGDIATLTPDEAEMMRALPNVEAAVPGRSSRMTIRYGDIDVQTSIQGTGADFPFARDWPPARGQFFSSKDVQSYAPVVTLGQTVARNLFSDSENPIGKFVIVKNVPMQVIGVMTPKGASSNGNDQDDVVFIPYTTGFVRLFGQQYLSNIIVKVGDVAEIDDTQNAIHDLLLRRHKVEDFNIRNMASVLETATETQNTLTLLLGVVAAISLVVGGIGVMNIMLVSVTERTREIGIRMATGARRQDILLQFNIESVVVCAIGGMLGVAAGIVFGLALELSGMRVIFTLWPPLLAFTCACATGIVFGYLPASKAAHMDPVVALASE
jgi:macrolide transport system ATP-binding/permease protein